MQNTDASPLPPADGPAPAPEGSAEAQVAANAVGCVQRFAEWDVALDFGPGSLRLVDEVLGAYHRIFVESGTLPPGHTVPLVADYLCEVARKQYGGEYAGGDEANPVVLHIRRGGSGVVLFAREKVLGRVRNGGEDSLPFFYEGIDEALQRDGVTMLR